MPKSPEGRTLGGTVELFPEFQEGLADLEGFSHVILIFHMHLSEGPLMKVRPRNERRPRGVFSTRSPRRPNPIGVTVARLEGIEGSTLRVFGIDIADGTPLLDIKPYIPQKDRVGRARTGWFAKRAARLVKVARGKKTHG